MTKTQDLYTRAVELIPGGSQLLSKRPEQFCPEQWPAYYQRASGVEIEDLDGRKFIDVSIHSVGACPLGYADSDVNRAVIAAIESGSIATPNCPEEVELAELLIELHPWAQMVRYARGGGEAMAIAVRLARAKTNRSKVAVCGYHGWHDWYIAANLQGTGALDGHLLPNITPAGIPSELAGTTVAFPPNDLNSLGRLIASHGDQLAAVVLEPARYELPAPGYLEEVCRMARECGAVVVFDEITSGFRAHLGGLHQKLEVAPDVAVFAKAMSNGYPMAAIIGREAVMEFAHASFVSSTYWSERTGPAAALCTIRKMRSLNVPAHLGHMGTRMRRGWEQAAQRAGLPIETRGIDSLPSFSFTNIEDPRAVCTLYSQYMMDDGYLAFTGFYPTFAHTPEIVNGALLATEQAFTRLQVAISAGTVLDELRGPVASSGLRATTRVRQDHG